MALFHRRPQSEASSSRLCRARAAALIDLPRSAFKPAAAELLLSRLPDRALVAMKMMPAPGGVRCSKY